MEIACRVNVGVHGDQCSEDVASALARLWDSGVLGKRGFSETDRNIATAVGSGLAKLFEEVLGAEKSSKI